MEQQLVLSNGVRMEVRPVPPYVQAAVRQALPEPPFPSVTLESKSTGNKEVVPVLPGTEAYEEYRKAVSENRLLVRTAMTSFNLDYGVLRWQYPNSDDWVEEAPRDWEVPHGGLLTTLGVTKITEFNTRRSLYIRFELLIADSDVDRVDRIIYSKQALTKEEILAALVPFDSNDEIDLWNLRAPN